MVEPRRDRPCEYGVMGVLCGQPSVTMRPRPSGHGLNAERWQVCQRHADALDRLRANIARHKHLLDRLAGNDG